MFHPLKLWINKCYEANFISPLLGFSLEPWLVSKLILIDQFNSHDYHGHCATSQFSSMMPSESSALFLFRSQIFQSCSPNAFFSSHTSDGKLECTAVRSIKAGDMITSTYIDQFEDLPTHQRRKFLIETHEYMCRCPRCIGPDYLRPVHCKKCSEGVLLCTDVRGDSPVWSCNVCGDLKDEKRRIEALEEEIEDQISCHMFIFKLDPMEISPNVIKNVLDRASTKLHPQHFLTQDCVACYARVCDFHALNMSIQTQLAPSFVPRSAYEMFGTLEKLMSETARVGVQLAEMNECVATGSIGPSNVAQRAGRKTNRMDESNEPAPSHAAYYSAFIAARSMMRFPSSKWSTHGRDVVHRYAPLMKLYVRGKEEDIDTIFKKIPVAKKDVGNKASSAPQPNFSVAVEKKAKQRRKKRGRTNKKKKGGKK